MRSGFVTAVTTPWRNGDPLPERKPSPALRREQLLKAIEEAARDRQLDQVVELNRELAKEAELEVATV